MLEPHTSTSVRLLYLLFPFHFVIRSVLYRPKEDWNLWTNCGKTANQIYWKSFQHFLLRVKVGALTHQNMNIWCVEERADQQNAQINFGLIN